MILLTRVDLAWAAPMALSQYSKEVWSSREGLPEGTIFSLKEQGDYLWIGNECCLLKFDGETFLRVDNTPQLGQHSFTRSLLQTPTGMWAGFAGGLAHFADGEVQWFSEAQGFTHPYVYSLASDQSTVWIGTGGEGIWQLNNGKLTPDSQYHNNNLPVMIHHLLADHAGRVWAATENGIIRREAGEWARIPSARLPSQMISQLAERTPGELWVGTLAGLVKWNGTDFEPYAPLLNLPVSALFADRNKNLWVGSKDTLFRINEQGVESLALKEGAITVISDDPWGNIWIGTQNGLVRLHPGALTTFSTYEGMLSESALSATTRKAGGIWLLDDTGTLGHFADNQYSQDSGKGAINGGSLLGMVEDAEGVLWIAAGNLYRYQNGQLDVIDVPGDGLSLVAIISNELWLGQTAADGFSTLYRYQNGNFEAIDLGITLRHVQRIEQSRSGEVWITTAGSGVVQVKNGQTKQFTSADGLPSDTVYGLTEDPDGRIWLATREGLGFIQDQRATSLAKLLGAPKSSCLHIKLDAQDRFWVTESGQGIHILPRQALLQAVQNPAGEMPLELLTTHHGLRSLAFSWRHGGVATSLDGQLHFLTPRGVTTITPDSYSKSQFHSKVRLYAVAVNGQHIRAGEIQLADRADVIDLQYGAAHLADSDGLEFRTRLGNAGTQWSPPTRARTTRLTNLAPGNYQFEIAVRHKGQAWLSNTETISISVPPYFYERTWVKAAGILFILSLVVVYFRRRITTARNLELYLRTTVAKRTAELNLEIIDRKAAEEKALHMAQTLEERVQERTVELEFAKMAVFKSEERFALAVQGAEDGIWDWDLAQHTLYLSPRWKAILGFKDHEFPSTIDAWLASVHPEDADLVRDLLVFADPHPNIRQEYRMLHREGHILWVLCRGVVIRDTENNLPIRAAGSQTDITHRKHTEDALRDSLTRDPVTDLPNRALFLDRLDQALLKRRSQESQVTILLLDIDGFKLINEKYGHAAGDDILREIARRILSSLRQTDTLARLGNDEFAMLLLEIEEEQQAEIALERIKSVLQTPINIGNQEIKISYSMGVKQVQQGETQADEMLIAAENALDHAKVQGGNRVQTVNQKNKGRRELEKELLQAIKEEEFILYFQPLVDLSNDRVVGTEALARWNHPERGLLGPQHFISLLEACGLMDIFSEWVMLTCCKQAAIWREQFADATITVSFNLPASHLNNPRLVDHVQAALNSQNLPANYLAIEIVESSLIESNTIVIDNLERLRKIGLPVSIDDFGTGYSSMNYLKQFPVDCIKIDKSFCQGVPDNSRDVAICESLLSIAEQLGLKAIIEGVETEKQMQFFKARAKLIAQGYYFSKPAAPEICTEFIYTHNYPSPRCH